MSKKKNRILLVVSIAFLLIGFLPFVVDFSNIMNKDPMYITISFFALGSVFLSFWGLEAHEDERAKKQKGIRMEPFLLLNQTSPTSAVLLLLPPREKSEFMWTEFILPWQVRIMSCR